MPPANPFEATAAALGYVYQFRYALVRSLDALNVGTYNWQIAIEAADDIEWETGSTRELTQLKHVQRPPTDSSSELWKTLRIWSEGVRLGRIDPSACSLCLVTTATISAGSVASLLGPDLTTRDEGEAEAILLRVCEESANEDNSKSYNAFKALRPDQRTSMLRSICVLGQNPNAADLHASIIDHIRVGTRREHLEPIAERLEGWWFHTCIKYLTGDRSPVTCDELDSVIYDLRDQFGPTNLPIDRDITEDADPQVDEFEHQNFVRQIKLTSAGHRRIQMAVRDYLRAYTQRSRWARLNLTQSNELSNYERILREEWELLFEQMCDSAGKDAAESEKTAIANEIYQWVENADVPPIRSHCTEPFVKRGTYHMLADRLDVGWHPDFRQRLAAILEPSGAS